MVDSSAGVPWDDGAIAYNLTRKGEALAVSGLVNYGDEIDVIAPADILKQIFKMPYSKARLSIAVHRIGQTLVLNPGPDVEEGERLARRNQPKCSDESLFLNFAMHSVRMEACDCPPTHSASGQGRSKSSVVPDLSKSGTSSFKSSEIQRDDVAQKEQHDGHGDYSKTKQNGLFWESKKNKRNKARDPVKKASHIGEKSRCPMQESDKYRRGGNEEFLRVLFWQFHNFRMLLGSDLLLFSNDKYASVSLHLWDISRQVTPLTWLEAWLDNVMASVPELAICYHQNGVVQGYELLKTDDIFLLKGVSEDGIPAFHPYVVQQNGLSVLRFLQANCTQDPGAYWLYKSSGEDVIQLFDLSIIPKNHASDSSGGCSSSLPSLIHRGRADSLLSLGTLLYRIAHRLSLSVAPNSRTRCAKFFRKCLELLDEPDHLVVRAFAHEQFARLILNSDEELDVAAEAFPLASEVIVTDPDEESLDIISSISTSSIQNSSYSDMNNSQDSLSNACQAEFVETDVSESISLIASNVEAKNFGLQQHDKVDESDAICNRTPPSTNVIQTIADPVSSKLAAVHHISLAIKSLRWTRQLQGAESESVNDDEVTDNSQSQTARFSVCACGETDCIEVCDIREWLPTSKLDHKLWKLVLLLGESYLALGQAYKDDGQLLQALKVVEVACSVYGSVPQYLDDAKFISSINNVSTSCYGVDGRQDKQGYLIGDEMQLTKNSCIARINLKHCTSTYLFWARAWTLVGDVYVEFLAVQSKETITSSQTPATQELKMSSEVVKELIRLKKKLGQGVENCSSCSLVNCSCQSDRASSGNSASSSGGQISPFNHGRRQNKRSNFRPMAGVLSGNPETSHVQFKGGSGLGINFDMTQKKDCKISGETDSRSKHGIKEEYSASSSREDDRREKSSCSAVDVKMAVDGGGVGALEDTQNEATSEKSPKTRSGGIFKYLQGPGTTDSDGILLVALCCYEAARKALDEVNVGSDELQSVLKKIGWVCNELGRSRLERKDLAKAEVSFAKAINAFREVSDHANIILINCNLGHGRRTLAEELVTKLEYLKSNSIFHNAYKQTLESAIREYSKSLKYYAAAKSELDIIGNEADDFLTRLKNEAYTQFAHTYLRLGMLLAREDTVADVYAVGDDKPLESHGSTDKRTKKDHRNEISANEAIREALSIYESLGELRKQEAAYAHFQLACYQRDCCLKFLNSSHARDRSSNKSKSEGSILQRAKQYLSLAERNWLKAVEFYSAKTHPVMFLTILIERAALLSNISDYFHSHMMLETALSCLLEGRYVSDYLHSDSCQNDNPEIHAKFWMQLQMLLKKMLASSLSGGPSKAISSSQATSSSSRRAGDAEKLKELYRMSLKSTNLNQLHSMNSLWIGAITVP